MMSELVTRARMWPAADYASPLLNELADAIEAAEAKLSTIREEAAKLCEDRPGTYLECAARIRSLSTKGERDD
jgi:hypothetical protein